MSWQAAAAQAAGSVIGGLISSAESKSMQKKALAYADAYNKNKIQWLAEDAGKAGIHPLAALGSSVAGGFASPSFVQSNLGDSIGGGIAALGGIGGDDEEYKATGSPKQLGPTQGELLFQDLQLKKLNAEIDEITSRTRLMNARSGAIGGAVSNSSQVITDPDMRKDIRVPFLGDVALFDGASAQQAEDKMGEISDWLYGGHYGAMAYGRAVDDAHRWYKRNTFHQTYGHPNYRIRRQGGGD